jgi:hypothetical protein
MSHPAIPTLVRLDGGAGQFAFRSGTRIRVELAGKDELGELPAPVGVSPTGDGHADERHALAIDPGRVVVRAVEPVGVACAP